MRKTVINVLVLLLVAGLGAAATYTITTTTPQETKISRARVQLNAPPTNAGYADNNALVQDLCGKTLLGATRDVDDQDANALANIIRNATQAQRDAACTAAGGTVSNGRCQ